MNCCKKNNQKLQKNKRNKNKKGILTGIAYGLIPHIGCIGFIIFSILGVTTAATVFRPLLLNRYFFHILILISFIFATISALIYLKKNGILSFPGIKRKKGYLLTLYGTTIGVNLILFMLIFPIMANINVETNFFTAATKTFFNQENVQVDAGKNILSIKVDIPCSGHAFLIINEVNKIAGVENVNFRPPNLFDVNYSPENANQEEILSSEIFEIYPATIINRIN